MWRLGADIGFTRAFAIHSGLLSHWQVWLAISVAIQFVAILLNRYGAGSKPDQHGDVKERLDSLVETRR
jgi:hypothetical protein